MEQVMTFEIADYKYKCHMSDKGSSYWHPVKELSGEYPKWWILRDENGVIAIVCKKTGKINPQAI